MNIRRIKETCIYVSDLAATKSFYAGKLGLPMISMVNDRHVFFRAGASVLLCFIAGATEKETELPPHGASGAIHFAFETGCDAYNETLQHIEAAGVTITHRHVWKNGLRSFYFNDPDGNLVEIIEEGLWDM